MKRYDKGRAGQLGNGPVTYEGDNMLVNACLEKRKVPLLLVSNPKDIWSR